MIMYKRNLGCVFATFLLCQKNRCGLSIITGINLYTSYNENKKYTLDLPINRYGNVTAVC